MADFFDWSIVGLEGWEFPEVWTMVDGDRVVSFWWNRLPGTDAAGRPYQVPALSILHYAGHGKFDYELDVTNIAEVAQVMARELVSAADASRTVRTGQGALDRTRSAVLPRKSRSNPERPCVPMAIRSAWTF